MLFSRRGIRAFNEYDLRQTLSNQLERLRSDLKTNNKVGSNEDQINDLVKEYTVKPLKFNVDDIEVSVEEEKIPSKYFPQSNFFVEQGESYPKDVYTFFLPFDGDETLLRCVPSTRIMWTEEIVVESNKVVFQIIDFYNSVENIQKERDRIIKFLSDQSVNVNRDINSHNQTIEAFISSEIKINEEKRMKQNEALVALGKPAQIVIDQNKTQRLQQPTQREEKKYDVFISHASEDKDYVDTLANRLKKENLEVWYDTFEINWGDDLRPTIDGGLKNSKFGIVILSKSFLKKKKWTEYELNGLFAQERNNIHVVLPVWHKITRKDVEKYSPTFADRVAKLSDNVDDIIIELKKLLKK